MLLDYGRSCSNWRLQRPGARTAQDPPTRPVRQTTDTFRSGSVPSRRPAIARTNEGASGAIENAARQLFATQGFAGTSMRDLARSAGVSSAGLYNYTTSKEELLWRVTATTLRSLLADAEAALAGSPCPAAQLAAVAGAHARHHALHPRPARIGNTELQHLSLPHRHEVAGLKDRYERAFRDVIDEGGRLGFFDLELERYAAFSILEMGFGVGVWFRAGGELSVAEIGEVYGRLALRMVAFDPVSHDLNCPDPTHAR
ncbi:TetR/AcrR family transcriptional regulator [Pseudonocardia halophobica]|uniref:TetR/AcrR family transcriptional regulator n=1 Tax=Pseudonocardia halophobica TaxID=29401 RepID=UPI003D8A2E47